MSRVVHALVAACKDKSCAPPPVGTGGSTQGAGTSAVDTGAVWNESYDRRESATGSGDILYRNAVRSYTTSGHKKVNEFLRYGAEFAANSGWNTDRDWETVRMMDKAFDMFSVRVPGDIEVHRGIVLDGVFATDAAKQFRKGQVIEDKAFVSTSMERDQVHRFSDRDTWGNDDDDDPGTRAVTGVEFSIKIPKGARVLAGHYNEKEIILPRGSRFRVVGTRKTSRRFLTVDLELVQ